MTAPFIERDPNCGACRDFYKLVAAQCARQVKVEKPKKAPTPKPAESEPESPEDEGEAATPVPAPVDTPLKIHLQREPSLATIQATLDLFVAMAEDEPMVVHYLPVVERLLSVLRLSEGRAPGERDYFANLAVYVEAPFRRHLKHAKAHPPIESAEQQEIVEEAKEQFFDF
jgi:hypothetical protein